MKVKELIEKLKEMPQNADVFFAHTEYNCVYHHEIEDVAENKWGVVEIREKDNYCPSTLL